MIYRVNVDLKTPPRPLFEPLQDFGLLKVQSASAYSLLFETPSGRTITSPPVEQELQLSGIIKGAENAAEAIVLALESLPKTDIHDDGIRADAERLG